LVALLTTITLPFTPPGFEGAKTTCNVAVWLGPNVKPDETPFALNPVPEVVTLEIVTFEFPLFVRVTFSVLLLPSFTLPKLKPVGLAPRSSVATTPVPEPEIVNSEFDALLTSDTDPFTAPAVVGANTTLNEVLVPAPIVSGNESPLALKPAPETLACVIVTLAVPVLDKLIVWELLMPVTTFPKLALEGIAERCPWTPVPLSATTKVGSVAVLVIVIVPEAFPVAVGVNFAVNDVVWPAPSDIGTENPVMLRPVPVALAWEIVMLVVPEFVSVKTWVPLLPTTTLPNAKLPGFAFSVEFAEIPVPVSGNDWGDAGSLSVKLMFPVTPPAATGWKRTVNERLWLALRVVGKERPLMLNPSPVTVAPLTTRLVSLLFASLTVCVLLWPTVTFPKLREEGVIVSAAGVPIPLTGTDNAEVEASLTMDKLPVIAPADCGANWIWIVPVWPTGIGAEGLPFTTEKPVPEMVAWEMLTGAVPVFVTVRVLVAVLPTGILPKLRLLELGESAPVFEVPGWPFPAALVYATQLDSPTKARMSARVASRVKSLGRLVLAPQSLDAETRILWWLLCACIFMMARTV
jgi:hypothetical protein